ncbi:MAG: toprim domain-containing protein [Bacteroidota bacterium]
MKFEDFNIEIDPAGSSQQKTTCPECKNHGKQHLKDKCLSVNLTNGIWKCHKCGWTGTIKEKMKTMVSERRTPIVKSELLTKEIMDWFDNRGIGKETLRKLQIKSAMSYMPQKEKRVRTICFEYMMDDQLVNVKYRDKQKNFIMNKGAELVFYNIDSIKGHDSVVVVEGEVDALSYVEAGIENVISVPNGASFSSNGLKYFDNCASRFNDVERVYLATDNDPPGIKLRTELVRRFGVERCYKVDLKDCKDPNEYLVKYDKAKLCDTIKDAKPFPLEGIYTLNDVEQELDNIYENGLPVGLNIGIDSLDNLITYEPGRFYTITGIPGHGKSEFLDFVVERLMILHKLKFAIFSPENGPIWNHASRYIEKLSGRKFGKDSMNRSDFNKAKEFIKDRLFFIESNDESFSLQMILDKTKSLIHRYGVNGLIIDPWNSIEFQSLEGLTETLFISKQLTEITTFARVNNILIFLVAHPTKMQKDIRSGMFEVPNLYNISGSANFFNKTDFGLSIHRNFKTGIVTVYVQKAKFDYLGKVGNISLQFDEMNRRFAEIDFSKDTGGKTLYDRSNHLELLNQDLLVFDDIAE